MKFQKIMVQNRLSAAGTEDGLTIVLAGESQTDVPELITLHRSMPAEVMVDFDTIIFFGQLVSDSPRRLTIRRTLDGTAFPRHHPGSMVLIRAYDTAGTPVLIRAKVMHSSAAKCTVEEPELIQYKTKRKTIRYPIYPPANIYLLDDALRRSPQPCLLINISTSGACVVSKYSYALRQVLEIHIELAAGCGRFAHCCQVIRTAPRKEGRFEYGLSFPGLDQMGYDHLCLEIQAVQREMEKRFCPEL